MGASTSDSVHLEVYVHNGLSCMRQSTESFIGYWLRTKTTVTLHLNLLSAEAEPYIIADQVI